MIRNLIVFLIILFLSFHAKTSFSQEFKKINSLKKEAAKLKTAEAYLDVSDYYINDNPNRKSAYLYLDSGYKAAVREKSNLYLGLYYFQKSRLYSTYGADSVMNYRQALKNSIYHYEKEGFTAFHAFSYLAIGASLVESNKIDSAILYLRKGLNKYQENPKLPTINVHQRIYTLLTHAFKIRGRSDSALVYAKKTIDVSTQLKDSVTIANYYYTLAGIYKDLNQVDACLKYYKLAGDWAVKVKDFDLASTTYREAAGEYNNQKNPAGALPLARLGLKYAQLIKDTLQEGWSWSTIATAYMTQEKYQDAVDCYRKAMSCYSGVKDEKGYHLMNIALMNAFSKLNRQDSAWAYMNKLEAAGDLNMSDSSEAIPNSFQELELKKLASDLLAEEKQLKLNVIKQQYLEHETAALRQRIWFISISSCLVIVMLLLLYNRQRHKIKAERNARYAKEKEDEFAALQKDTEIRLIKKYIDGLESERERIAKDLHDGICNDLLALEMDMKLNPQKELDFSLKILAETRESARNISHKLMPPVFQDATLNEMMLDYTDHLELPGSMLMEYDSWSDLGWEDVPQDIAYEIYRITQELLSNCVKHSMASQVRVILVFQENMLQLEICDNGSGFDKFKKSKGIGLRTVSERAKSIGAELSVDSSEKGTNIKIVVHI